MRNTSLTAYYSIRDSGLVSKLRFAVYHTLFNYGPLTQGELWKKYFPYSQRHSIAPRFAELEAQGIIEPIGERACEVTGKRCIVWDVNKSLPKKYKKVVKTKCPHCEGKGVI
jgi:hypothetical protein